MDYIKEAHRSTRDQWPSEKMKALLEEYLALMLSLYWLADRDQRRDCLRGIGWVVRRLFILSTEQEYLRDGLSLADMIGVVRVSYLTEMLFQGIPVKWGKFSSVECLDDETLETLFFKTLNKIYLEEMRLRGLC